MIYDIIIFFIILIVLLDFDWIKIYLSIHCFIYFFSIETYNTITITMINIIIFYLLNLDILLCKHKKNGDRYNYKC